MVNNLPDNLKTNWVDNETVMPVNVNGWSSAINKIKDAIPVYSANGNFYTATYGSNVYSLSPITMSGETNVPPSAYIDGMKVVFKCPTNNSANCSINVNSLGNKSIKNLDGSNIGAGVLVAGNYIELIYDNSQGYFKLLTAHYLPISSVASKGSTSLPVYFDADGKAQPITSYQGNSATATKATQDQNGDVIDATYTKNTDEKFHALKGYSDNGELLTDAKGLADVTKYAHSTFDSSKFTVVGSPTITDDGIASGFSSENYIQNSFTAITPQKEFIVKLRVKQNSTVTSTNRLWTSKDNANFFIAMYANGYISCRLTGSANLISIYKSDVNWELNQDIDITLKVTPTKTYLTVACNGSSYIGESATPYTFISMSGCYFGGLYAFATNCSIDLKEFKIYVDGAPVFSGNKTGIDTIKADDYTVVGTPTISADEIVSGLSGDNYLISSQNISYTQSLVLECTYIWNGIIPTGNSWLFSLSDGTNEVKIYHTYYQNKNIITPVIKDQYYVNSNQISANIPINIKFVLTQTTAQAIVSQGNQIIVNDTKEISINNFTTLYIGRVLSGGGLIEGSIDLNAFKVYIDGDLVYQSCLKIPYTESKTGSKIVDSVYRPRVNDMAYQFGYANYYTLDEDNGNFTLPQVELYGLINKIKQETPYIIDSYINGANGYITLSNGLHIERGVATSTTDRIDIAFYKNFKDTDYSFIQSFEFTANVQTSYPTKLDTKTTSGISIFSSSGLVHDWIAIGYIF